MGVISIAAYRPKEGRTPADVLAVLHDRLPLLRSLGLATDRPAIVMLAADGTVLEASEWASPAAIERAHRDPQVLALWDRFEAVCTYVPLRSLPESEELFASFTAV